MPRSALKDIITHVQAIKQGSSYVTGSAGVYTTVPTQQDRTQKNTPSPLSIVSQEPHELSHKPLTAPHRTAEVQRSAGGGDQNNEAVSSLG